MLRLVEGLGPEDLVLCLLSGGGSSLLVLPPPGAALAEVKAVNSALLRSGAPIHDMNRVRPVVAHPKRAGMSNNDHPSRVVFLDTGSFPNGAGGSADRKYRALSAGYAASRGQPDLANVAEPKVRISEVDPVFR
jgi:hypothetical protein